MSIFDDDTHASEVVWLVPLDGRRPFCWVANCKSDQSERPLDVKTSRIPGTELPCC